MPININLQIYNIIMIHHIKLDDPNPTPYNL